MANDLATRPLKIDTVMTSGAALARPVRVSVIYWLNPVTAADVVTIIDPVSSKVLFTARCEVGAQSQLFQFPQTQVWKDFKVSVIGSGTLYIHTK